MGNSESAQGAWIGGWLIGAILAPVTGGASLIAASAVVTGSTVALVHHNNKRTPPSANPMTDRIIGFAGGGVGAACGGAVALGADVTVSASAGAIGAALPITRTSQPKLLKNDDHAPEIFKPTKSYARPTTSAAASATASVAKPTPAAGTSAAKPTPSDTASASVANPTPAAAKPTTSAADAKPSTPKLPSSSISASKVSRSQSVTHTTCSKSAANPQLERCTIDRVKVKFDNGSVSSEAGVAVRDRREQHSVLKGSNSDGNVFVAYERNLLAPPQSELQNVRTTTKFGTDKLYLRFSSDDRTARIEVGGHPSVALTAAAAVVAATAPVTAPVAAPVTAAIAIIKDAK